MRNRREALLSPLLAMSLGVALGLTAHRYGPRIRKIPPQAPEQPQGEDKIPWEQRTVTVGNTTFAQVHPFNREFRNEKQQSFPFIATISRQGERMFRNRLAHAIPTQTTLLVYANEFNKQAFVFPKPSDNSLIISFPFDLVATNAYKRFESEKRVRQGAEGEFANFVARELAITIAAHVFYARNFTEIGIGEELFSSSLQAWNASLEEAREQLVPIVVHLQPADHFHYWSYYQNRFTEVKNAPLFPTPFFQTSQTLPNLDPSTISLPLELLRSQSRRRLAAHQRHRDAWT